MDLTIAWRNIWRNPRRTLVIMTAVVVGVWNMLVLAALMRGIETEMVKNSLSDMTASLQIHAGGYLDDPVVENSMADTVFIDGVLDRLVPEKAVWSHRIRVNAVASNARHSTGVNMVGIEPAREARVSFIGSSVVEGRYLTPEDDHAILVGRAFLKSFNTRAGHKVILMSQDTRGQIASRAFRVVGVFKAETEIVEKSLVFVTRNEASRMLELGDACSETAVLFQETDMSGKRERLVASSLSENLGEGYDVSTWRDLLPMLRAYLDTNDFFLYIWYGVVFVAMGFGVVNTTLMAVYERMREFGLLKALGMTPSRIIKGVILESFFLLILGITAGTLLGWVTVIAIAGKGIDLSSLAKGADMWGLPRVIVPVMTVGDVATAGIIVMILGLLVSLYPAVRAARFTPVEAMMIH